MDPARTNLEVERVDSNRVRVKAIKNGKISSIIVRVLSGDAVDRVKKNEETHRDNPIAAKVPA
jgi:hypothetical protein